MRKGLLSALILSAAQTAASAQTLFPGNAPTSADSATETVSPFAAAHNAAPASACPEINWSGDVGTPRTWVSGEYLLWWVRKAPSPGPLLTTGNPTSPTAGRLDDKSTVVLAGNGDVGFGAFSGGRLGFGRWLDDDATVGFEVSGFLLEQRAVSGGGSSSAAGLPVLAFPTTNPNGTASAYYISSPGAQAGPFAGRVAISTASRTWGAEANGVFNAWREGGQSLDFLVGFRYLGLQEDLQDHVFSIGTTFPSINVGNDSFTTRNNFYGGQAGARWSWHGDGKLSADVTGLLALGATDQIVSIDGTNVITSPGVAPIAFRGFVYAQPSNIGQFHHTDFSVVPQVQLKLGYDLTSSIRLSLAYDFLFWSDVARPGEEVDRVVNISQTPPLGYGGGNALVGPARPSPMTNHSDFWAQGVSFGIEFKW